jgi:tubulin-specific chaperone A
MLSTSQERDLKIKTGVLKRINKELLMYTKEGVSQQARIDKMVAANEDIHEVRQQEKVLVSFV